MNNFQFELVYFWEIIDYYFCIDYFYIIKYYNYEYGLLECYWSDYKLQYFFI